MKYVLASASPRRQELLTQAGFTFDVIPSAIEEKITKDIPSDVGHGTGASKKLLMYSNHRYCIIQSTNPKTALSSALTP